MKKFIEPEIEFVQFTVEDIITASGDGNSSNNAAPTSFDAIVPAEIADNVQTASFDSLFSSFE